MHAPDREVNAFMLERFVPREHVLIDAIDERAVEIEEERLSGHAVMMAGSERDVQQGSISRPSGWMIEAPWARSRLCRYAARMTGRRLSALVVVGLVASACT